MRMRDQLEAWVASGGSNKGDDRTMTTFEMLYAAYCAFSKEHNRAPNALMMGPQDCVDIAKEAHGRSGKPTLVTCTPSWDISSFQGCPVYRTMNGGFRFALVSVPETGATKQGAGR